MQAPKDWMGSSAEGPLWTHLWPNQIESFEDVNVDLVVAASW